MLPNLLVATGNYDIIAALRRAIRADRVIVKAAYSNRDLMYMLAQQSYDVLVLDASMADRYTHEHSIINLTQNKSPVPCIGVALSDEARARVRSLGTPMISTLDKNSIQEAVYAILGTAIPAQETHVLPHSDAPTTSQPEPKRSQELKTMAALSRSLTEVLDLSEVLNRVVEAARLLTNAEEGMILLPDETDPRRLVLRARVGIDIETAQNFRIRVDDTLPGEVFREGKPSLGAERNAYRLKTDFLVRAVLYVPIMLRGKSIGVLGVNNRTRADTFNTHQQELLEDLASYASIAIQNASIHEESVQRAKELEMLVKASQTISASLVMDETLTHICEQLALVLKISRAEIYRWDQVRETLDLRAHFYQALWRGLKGPVIDLTRIPDIKETLEADQHRWLPGEEFTTLVVPVTADNRLLGGLRCYYVKEPQQNPKRESALHDVRRVALDVLAAVLNQSQDSTEEDVYLLLNYINQLIQSDWSELSLLSAKGNSLIVLAMAGKATWVEPPFQQIHLSSRPELATVLNDQTMLEPDSARGVFALPLAHRGDSWGVVLLSNTDRSRVYTRGEMEVARALVNHAAIALENAQLVRDLEQSLTELREAQEKLVQTARLSAMGELAAVVAHQINNPLTTITVETEMMLEYEPHDSENYESLLAISRAGRRAAGVARRLLAISRPNDPQTTAEVVDVIETVEGILSLVGTHIERRNIKIHTRLPEGKLPGVLAIKGQLDDVWLNLLMNAHDALGDRPNSQIGVEVAYRQLDEQLVVRIWDNGPGIPDELKERIFRPFFTTKRPGEGTGLGLHVCRQVVERAGGTITVESAVDKGTRFTIELPTIKNDTIRRKLELMEDD